MGANAKQNKGKGKKRTAESSAPTQQTQAVPTKRAKLEDLLPEKFDIVAGSYERLLYGLRAAFTSESTPEQPKLSLQLLFSFAAHTSCIKTLAMSQSQPPQAHNKQQPKRWLATGSTDESIKIWDMNRRKEIGELAAVHQGAITALAWSGSNMLLSASTDATLNLFRTKDWTILRTFSGSHKARVNSIAIHPGGRIALSVAADRNICLWDLLGSSGQAAGGGKQGSNSTKLGLEGDVVRWNADGTKFAVICGHETRIYDTTMTLLKTLESKGRFHDVKFVRMPTIDEELLLLACEDGKGRIYKLSADAELTPIGDLVGHQNRIKGLEVIRVQHPSTSTKGPTTLYLAATASSDGKIHVYSLQSLQSGASETQIEPTATFDTKGTRLTCLGVSGCFASEPQLEEDSDDEDEDEDEDASESDASDDAEDESGDAASAQEEVDEEEEWGGIESE